MFEWLKNYLLQTDLKRLQDAYNAKVYDLEVEKRRLVDDCRRERERLKEEYSWMDRQNQQYAKLLLEQKMFDLPAPIILKNDNL